MTPDFFPEACAIVGRQQEVYAAHRTGVCWSGMTNPAPVVEDVETVRQRLVKRAEDAKRFHESPRGRLYACIRELDALGYGEESYRLESLYRSRLADDREPLDVEAVGACLAILARTNHSTAREGELALAELLLAGAPYRRAA